MAISLQLPKICPSIALYTRGPKRARTRGGTPRSGTADRTADRTTDRHCRADERSSKTAEPGDIRTCLLRVALTERGPLALRLGAGTLHDLAEVHGDDLERRPPGRPRSIRKLRVPESELLGNSRWN